MDPEDVKKVDLTLDKARDKIENLREQRDELFEANKRLVELVKSLEAAYEEEAGGKVRFEGHEYSFKQGWTPTDIIHDKDLELEEPNVEEVDRQIGEVLETMKDVEDLNQRE